MFSIWIYQNSFATTISWEITLIQKKAGKDNYVIGYDLSRLERDIGSKESDWADWLPDYSIQRFSKEPGWSKSRFLEFTAYLERKNIKKALTLFEKNYQYLDVFSPTCCVWSFHIGFKPLKNGFITVHGWTQWGGIWYSLKYYFVRNWIIYSISKNIPFYDFIRTTKNGEESEIFAVCKSFDDSCTQIIKTGIPLYEKNYKFWLTKDIGSSELRKYLADTSRNSIFKKEYDIFISDMNKIWK